MFSALFTKGCKLGKTPISHGRYVLKSTANPLKTLGIGAEECLIYAKLTPKPAHFVDKTDTHACGCQSFFAIFSLKSINLVQKIVEIETSIECMCVKNREYAGIKTIVLFPYYFKNGNT